MNMVDEIKKYAASLSDLIAGHQLPASWFAVPDHLAFKGRDSAHYLELVHIFRPLAKRVSYIHLDNRRLATAELVKSVVAGDFGAVGWIEIMEPRPEKAGADVVGLEHMEFLYPDFEAVKAELSLKKVAYELQSNPNHQWINIVINSAMQEVKLSNKPLEAIVRQEIEQGEVIIL